MDMAELKREFGRSVIFHGGVDNQSVLPWGTAQQVRAEVKECLRALGAGRRQVLSLFLAEAVVLSLLGGFAGLLFGAGCAWLLGEIVSQLPVSFSTLFMGLALGLSVVIGLVAGILPALSAARLDPVEALRAE